MSKTTDTVKTGDPFLCPAGSCGGTEWIAHYTVPATQSVSLIIGEDGKPEVGDYEGDEETFDADEDEVYECTTCGAFINPDGTLREESTP